MAQNRIFKAWLAAAAGAGCALSAPAALAQEGTPDGVDSPAITLEAVKALRAAHAAKAAAAAAHAEAVAAAAPPVQALIAPPAPTPPPTLHFASDTAATGEDLLGAADAMPVASAKLLAALRSDSAPVPPPALTAPPPPSATPTFAPRLLPPAAPLMAPPLPAFVPLADPVAPPTVLAALDAAPVRLPTAEALEAAVAAQSTPAPAAPAPVYAAAPAPPAPRALYAAASFAPHARRSAAQAGNARFMRAVVSTAAVSVEMPDVGRDISPLGIMLGQLVRSQETPGAQYGLGEEMAMPTRPRLMSLPEVALPAAFCSAEQRGAFLEGIYQPAMAIAQHNSELASAYVRKLRTLYDNYQLSGDTRSQGAIAAEAKDFARTSQAASTIQEELAAQFDDIMSTPVTPCGASQ